MSRTRDAQRFRKVYSYTRPTPRVETLMGSVATSEDVLRLDWKESVVAASSTHVPLSGNVSLTMDGVSLSLTDTVRVLLYGQSSSIENGIYDYAWDDTLITYSMTRSADAVNGLLTSMAAVAVETGSTHGGWGYLLTTSDPITVGTTPLTWTKTFGQGSAIFVSVDSPSERAKTNYSVSFDTDSRYPSEIGTDVFFFVSGSTTTGASSVFGGSVLTSGSLTAKSGLSGSLTRLHDGTSYIVAGTGVTVVSSSNGQIVISSTSTGAGSENYFSSSLAGSTFGTGTLALVGQSGLTSSLQVGSDVYFYVSGSTTTGASSVFGGSVVASGSVSSVRGFTGSLTRLVDGTSFIVAGTGVSVTSGASGQVTIESTVTSSPTHFSSSLAGSIYGTGSLSLSGQSDLTSSFQVGSDVFFFVSGTVGVSGSSAGRLGVFGGDLVTCGSIRIGSNFPPFPTATGEPQSGGGELIITGREILGVASSSTGPELRIQSAPGVGIINLGPSDVGAGSGPLSLRTGAPVNVTGSVADGGSGGYFEVMASAGGDTEDGTGGSGGYVFMAAGDGGGSTAGVSGSGGVGGDFTIYGGSGGSAATSGTGGTGGSVSIYAGSGGTYSNSGVAGTPGNVTIEAGFGSFNNDTLEFGPRGSVSMLGSTISIRSENAGKFRIDAQTSILGGDAHVTAGTHSTGSHSQNGGSVNITSGDGKLTDGTGGDVCIRTGIGHGTGSDGSIVLSAGSGSSPGAIYVGNGSLAANYVYIGHSTVRTRVEGALDIGGEMIIAGADVVSSSYQKGLDNFLFVSGTIGLTGSAGRKAVFGGDVVVSGSLTSSGSAVLLASSILPMTRDFYGVSGLQSTTSTSWTTVGVRPFDPTIESPNLTGSSKTLTFVAALQILTASVTASIRLVSLASGLEVNGSLITGTSAGLADVEILSSSLTLGADPDVLTGSNTYKVQIKQTGGLPSDEVLCYAAYMNLKWS